MKIKSYVTSKLRVCNFFIDFIAKDSNYSFHNNVTNTITNQQIETANTITKSNHLIYLVTEVPPFFKLNLDEKHKSIPFLMLHGYAINLDNYSSISDYMSHQFGAKSRGKIRTYLKRLEHCFNISYSMYYGEIEKDQYNELFAYLKQMINKRFSQRGEKHEAIDDWESYKKNTFSQIINKKASLFVIYDNDKPIDICLNYHYQNIIINYIRSYDIDYSKYRVGYIDIFKQLEWCFENNYKVFDFCSGDLAYKKQWCNYIYNHKGYVVFYSKSLLNTFLGIPIGLFFKFMSTSKRNNKTIKKTDSIVTQKNNFVQFKTVPFPLNNKETTNNNNYEQINIEKEEFAFLRKSFYDFLYLNFETKNNSKIYKSRNLKNQYFIQGKKDYLLTSINN